MDLNCLASLDSILISNGKCVPCLYHSTIVPCSCFCYLPTTPYNLSRWKHRLIKYLLLFGTEHSFGNVKQQSTTALFSHLLSVVMGTLTLFCDLHFGLAGLDSLMRHSYSNSNFVMTTIWSILLFNGSVVLPEMIQNTWQEMGKPLSASNTWCQ